MQKPDQAGVDRVQRIQDWCLSHWQDVDTASSRRHPDFQSESAVKQRGRLIRAPGHHFNYRREHQNGVEGKTGRSDLQHDDEL
jgi:hypothetical protein